MTPREKRNLLRRVAMLEQTLAHLYDTLELQCTVNDATDQRITAIHKLLLLLSGHSSEGKPQLGPPEIIH